MVPFDDPEHNMYVSSFKLSICDRRADRPVKEHASTRGRSGRLGPPRVNVWLKRLDRPGDNLTRPGHPGPTQDVPRPPRSQSLVLHSVRINFLCPIFALSSVLQQLRELS